MGSYRLGRSSMRATSRPAVMAVCPNGHPGTTIHLQTGLTHSAMGRENTCGMPQRGQNSADLAGRRKRENCLSARKTGMPACPHSTSNNGLIFI